MALDAHAPISRRGLFAAALGGAAAAAAGVASRAERVLAAGDDGKNVVIGELYSDVRTATRFNNGTGGADKGVALAGPLRAVTVSNVDILAKTSQTVEMAPGRGSSVIFAQTSAQGGGTGVRAVSFSGTGLDGSGDRVGVKGGSQHGNGLRGHGQRGALLSGKAAQLRLQPSSRATHPARGKVGDLFLDKRKRLWICKGNRDWKQVA